MIKGAVPIRLPAELRPEQLTAIVDTREQTPLDLSPLRTISGTLATGDYSVRGLEHVVRVERKTLPDLIACVGRDRARFDAEVDRLLAYPVRCLVVESTWDAIEMGGWRGRLTIQAALGSLLGWMAKGLPILMAKNHGRAGNYTARILYTAARRRWREARTLVEGAREGSSR